MPNPPTTEAGATPFYGWKLLVVLFVIYFFNVSFPYYGGVVVNSIMSEDLGISRSTLGLGVSVFSMALGFAAPLAGYMVTKRGVRYTLLVGSGLLISGTLLMALVVTQPWHYVLIFGVLVGVGVAMGSIIPIQSCVTAWFSRRRSMAIAVVMSAAGFGSLAAAPLLVEAIDLAGGDWAYRMADHIGNHCHFSDRYCIWGSETTLTILGNGLTDYLNAQMPIIRKPICDPGSTKPWKTGVRAEPLEHLRYG